MGEYRTITAKLKSWSIEQKRTVFAFENPEGGNYDLKVSAFPPNIPELKSGRIYTFKMELVPMPNEPNKFYKNLARKAGRESEYMVQEGEASDDNYFEPDPPPKITSQMVRETKKDANEARETYWKNKEEAEAKQKPIITRLSCISSAASIVAGMAQAGKISSMEMGARTCLYWAKELETFATTGEIPTNPAPGTPKDKEMNNDAE